MRLSRFTLLYFFYSLLSTGTVFGSHIIGGDLSLQWINDYNYQLSYYLYFDILDANPQTEDPTIDVEVYRKSDNGLAEFYTIPRQSVENITYANPLCSSASWQMQLFTYSLMIELDPSQFNDPQGYYVVWERCCRNRPINIVDPLNSGAAFILEFPATSLMRDSSPAFKKNKGDFACVGNTFTMDYSATDIDNDSLLYEIVTPIKGHATNSAAIVPMPAPYPDIVWQPPYSLQNPTLGSVPFQINPKTGVIQFNSQYPGLFLFAVVCTEYRNGLPIGKVYHDFEVYVVDCPTNSPPKLSIINATDTLSRYGINLGYGQEACYSLLIQDNDVFSTHSLTTSPSNNYVQLSNISQSIIDPTNSTSSICVTGCTKDMQGNYFIVLEAQRCPTQYDTLSIQISIDPFSVPTIYTIPDVGSLQLPVFNTYNFQVIGYSTDTSSHVTLQTSQSQNILELLQYTDNGSTYTSPNSVQSSISLTPTCDALNQPPQKLYFNVITPKCNVDYTESIVVNVTTIANDSVFNVNKIPNVFTPNGDNINDTFPLKLLKNKSCGDQFVAFNVYNRWGGQVHRSNNLAEEWDGSNLPDGMYFYEAEYEKQTVKGYLQIVR